MNHIPKDPRLARSLFEVMAAIERRMSCTFAPTFSFPGQQGWAATLDAQIEIVVWPVTRWISVRVGGDDCAHSHTLSFGSAAITENRQFDLATFALQVSEISARLGASQARAAKPKRRS